MDITKNLTIVIPIRIDSEERKRNLDTVLHSLLELTSTYIIILEADKIQKYFYSKVTERVKYVFIEDNNLIFHRTRYLNQLIKMSKTNIVGIWDTDVLFDKEQIEKAAYKVLNGVTLCYPYDGRFIFIDAEESIKIRTEVLSFLGNKTKEDYYSFLGRPSVGGAFIVNKQRYLQAGGENEFFQGWGPEDAERFKRMEILKEPISRISGLMYHLYHPRGVNSTLGFDDRSKNNIKEFLKICKMNFFQLKEYISSWGIIAQNNENQ